MAATGLGWSTSQPLGSSVVGGPVAKLAAERVSRSEVAVGVRGVFGFSGAGVATRPRSRALSALAARRAPKAVTSSAPGLKCTVMIRPIARPATSSAQAPKIVNGPVSAPSMLSPTAPPAWPARPNSPINDTTATTPATASMVRGRGALGQSR